MPAAAYNQFFSSRLGMARSLNAYHRCARLTVRVTALQPRTFAAKISARALPLGRWQEALQEGEPPTSQLWRSSLQRSNRLGMPLELTVSR